ncbi:type II secretion system protein [Patescibacteria group bacterium]
MKYKSRRRFSAFTLIEILVVVAIIGILATLIVVNYNDSRAKARDAKRKQDISTYQSAIESYIDDYNVYPDADHSFEAATILWGCNVDACEHTPGNNYRHIQYLHSVLDDPLVYNTSVDVDHADRKLWKPSGTYDGRTIYAYFRYAYIGGGADIEDAPHSAYCNISTSAFSYYLSAAIENPLDSTKRNDGGSNYYRYEVGNARTQNPITSVMGGTCGIGGNSTYENFPEGVDTANIDFIASQVEYCSKDPKPSDC